MLTMSRLVLISMRRRDMTSGSCYLTEILLNEVKPKQT